MKRRLRILVVLISTVAMVLMLNVGVALADHGNNPNSPFAAAENNDVNPVADASLTPSPFPVGQNALGLDPTTPGPHPGQFKGFVTGNAIAAIARNPNCPAHYAP